MTEIKNSPKPNVDVHQNYKRLDRKLLFFNFWPSSKKGKKRKTTTTKQANMKRASSAFMENNLRTFVQIDKGQVSSTVLNI